MRENNRIKNIIFDMGNVLLQFRPQVSLDTFFETKEDKELVFQELFMGPEWIMADEGKITNEERYEPVSRRIPKRLHENLKKCVEGWDMCMKPVPGAKEFCQYVKDKGYKIYVLSNACNRFYHYFPVEFPLEDFDGVIVSSDVKMVKPDRAIYRYVCDTYGLKAEECLFIDDRDENVEAAKEAGMQGVVFMDNYDEIKEKFVL